jgi:hypothetical protein
MPTEVPVGRPELPLIPALRRVPQPPHESAGAYFWRPGFLSPNVFDGGQES